MLPKWSAKTRKAFRFLKRSLPDLLITAKNLKVAENLKHLRELGVPISLDGFGREIKPHQVDDIVEYCDIIAESAGGLFGMFFQTSSEEQEAARQLRRATACPTAAEVHLEEALLGVEKAEGAGHILGGGLPRKTPADLDS